MIVPDANLVREVFSRISRTAQCETRDDFCHVAFRAMSTPVRLVFRSAKLALAREYQRTAIEWGARFEARYSRFLPGSIVGQINASGGSRHASPPKTPVTKPGDFHLMYQRNRNGAAVLAAVFITLVLPAISDGGFKEGDQLPDLGSFKLEGKLPDKLKGQVILLDFWASWCGPCKESFPAMEGLQKLYGEKGLTIVAVSVDEKRENMERFLKSMKFTFATARDASQKLVAAADVSAMPTSFLIDRARKIRYVHNGFHGEQTAKQYKEEIEKLLKEKAS